MLASRRSASDDLGTNTAPKIWPPRNEFLSQFFASPVGCGDGGPGAGGGGGGGEDASPEEEEEDGLMYLRPRQMHPNEDDKLVVGVEVEERGEVLVHWDQGRLGAEASQLGHNRWLVLTAYDELLSRVKLLADADVKNDEGLNLDDVKVMRGDVPLPRKPWGFTAPSSGSGGSKNAGASTLETRTREFDLSKPLGVHLNLKTMEVAQVDSSGQGGAVLRVGWRLTSINQQVCRNARDLKACLLRLEQCSDQHQKSTASTWVFVVPSTSAHASTNHPPLAVLSGQRVRRQRSDGTLENAQIAFRLAPNGRYRDATSGEELVAAIKYFPEGREKALLETQGDFPQNGSRIPLFGEALEVTQAASVHIDTVRTTKFPAGHDNDNALHVSETHGAFPDRFKQPLVDGNNNHRQATTVRRRTFQAAQSLELLDRRRKKLEEEVVVQAREIEAVRSSQVQTALQKSMAEEVVAARRQAAFYKKQAAGLQRQVANAHHRRARDGPPANEQQPVVDGGEGKGGSGGDGGAGDDLAAMESPEVDRTETVADAAAAPALESSAPLPPPPPPPQPPPSGDSKTTARMSKSGGGGWWDRMHGRSYGLFERRDLLKVEAEAMKRDRDAADALVGTVVSILPLPHFNKQDGEGGDEKLVSGRVMSWERTNKRFLVEVEQGGSRSVSGGGGRRLVSVEVHRVKEAKGGFGWSAERRVLDAKVSAVGHLEREEAFQTRRTNKNRLSSSQQLLTPRAVDVDSSLTDHPPPPPGKSVLDGKNCCAVCGFTYRHPTQLPRKLNKGDRVEVRSSGNGNGSGGSSSYRPATIESVRSTGTFDVRFTDLDAASDEVGGGGGVEGGGGGRYQKNKRREEKNVSRDCIRGAVKGRSGSAKGCMCATRQALGYKVVSSSLEVGIKEREREEDEGKTGEDTATSVMISSSLTPLNGPRTDFEGDGTDKVEATMSATLSSTKAYRATTTVLHKSWGAMSDLDGELRRQRNVAEATTKKKAATTAGGKLAAVELFAARQQAWEDDRRARAEAKKAAMDAELTKQHITSHVASHVTSASSSSLDPSVGATKEKQRQLPEERLSSDGAPAVDAAKKALELSSVRHTTVNALVENGDVLRGKGAVRKKEGKLRPWSSEMENRTEAQARAKIERQLMAHGFLKQAVVNTVEALWSKMVKTLAAAKEKEGQRLVDATQATASPLRSRNDDDDDADADGNELSRAPTCPWDGLSAKERTAGGAALLLEALASLEDTQPGLHLVGCRARVLPPPPPQANDKSGVRKQQPPPKSEKVGVVKSWDAVTKRFVVEVREGPLPSAVLLLTLSPDRVEILDKHVNKKKEAEAGPKQNSSAHPPATSPAQPLSAVSPSLAQEKKNRVAVATVDPSKLDLLAETAKATTLLRRSTTRKEGTNDGGNQLEGQTNSASRTSAQEAATNASEGLIYVTHAAKGRLVAMQKVAEAEATAKALAEKRQRRQNNLRTLLGKHHLETKAIKQRLAVAVKAARAKGVAPKSDAEVLRVEAELNTLLNKNVYTRLMRGDQAGGAGDGGDGDLAALLAENDAKQAAASPAEELDIDDGGNGGIKSGVGGAVGGEREGA